VEQTIIQIGELVEIRKKALRQRAWYKILDGAERAIVSLTIRCVEKIRSPKLAEIVTAIVTKLRAAMTSQVEKLKETVGRPLARKLSLIAQSWGYILASKWAWDSGFSQYLAVMHMNTPRMFKTEI